MHPTPSAQILQRDLFGRSHAALHGHIDCVGGGCALLLWLLGGRGHRLLLLPRLRLAERRRRRKTKESVSGSRRRRWGDGLDLLDQLPLQRREVERFLPAVEGAGAHAAALVGRLGRGA